MANKNSAIYNATVLNALRSANAILNANLPNVTDANITEVYQLILNNNSLMNETMSTLVNVIGLQRVQTANWKHPFEEFKGGMLDWGSTIEDIFVNLANEYEQSSLDYGDVLKKYFADVQTEFYTINRKGTVFASSYFEDRLRKSFMASDGLASLIDAISKSLFTADEKKEYEIFKELLTTNKAKRSGLPVIIADPTSSEANAKAFVTTLRAKAYDMTFLSDKYNYCMVDNTANIDEQILFITPEVEAFVGVNVLAYAFNKSEADYLQRRILVDSFGDSSIKAVLVNKDYFVQRDTLYKSTTAFNELKLNWNVFLHHEGIYACNPFANAIVFTTDADANVVTFSINVEGQVVGSGSTTLPDFTAGQTIQCSLEADENAYKAHKWSITGQNDKADTYIDCHGILHISGNETSQAITVTVTAPEGMVTAQGGSTKPTASVTLNRAQ